MSAVAVLDDVQFPGGPTIDGLVPVTLADLVDAAALQTRVDRKYVLPVAVLDELLASLADGARVLDIDGRRRFGYESTYYDTPELDCYRDAARSRPNRYKARCRSYLDTDLHVLEVKTRSRGRVTVKHRRSGDPRMHLGLGASDRAFVRSTIECELDAAHRGDMTEDPHELRYIQPARRAQRSHPLTARLAGTAVAGLMLVLPACGTNDASVFAAGSDANAADPVAEATGTASATAVATTVPVELPTTVDTTAAPTQAPAATATAVPPVPAATAVPAAAATDVPATPTEVPVEATPIAVPAPTATEAPAATATEVPTEVPTAAPAASTFPAGGELLVSFTYQPSSSGQAKRPYVAVWVEDQSGNLVDTISLWFEQGRGSRWLPDLREWYRATSGQDVSMSGATRTPGTYTVAWDGTDMTGMPVPVGTYVLNIESAREHGPTSFTTATITVSDSGFTVSLPSAGEISAASATLAV